uniref:Uncharacterized protein n=1 Tax=Ditylenchus dipsaci TaxID=166011 RepID=A0A915D958_9BILA
MLTSNTEGFCWYMTPFPVIRKSDLVTNLTSVPLVHIRQTEFKLVINFSFSESSNTDKSPVWSALSLGGLRGTHHQQQLRSMCVLSIWLVVSAHYSFSNRIPMAGQQQDEEEEKLDSLVGEGKGQ